MRRSSILFCVFTVSCATSPPPPDNARSDTENGAEARDVVMHEEQSNYAIPPLKTLDEDETEAPDWGCTVATNTPDVRKHLGLGDFGPTESLVTTTDGPGFEDFEHDGESYAAYICEVWSEDSDECDGSVVQVAELAKMVGDKTEVIWSSKPHLGSGNPACNKYGGNMITDLDVGDFDGDGKPDMRFGVIDPTRPFATVRLFNGTTYQAMLPTGPANYDICKPLPALEYFVIKNGEIKATLIKKVPASIKEELEEAYLSCAECPDADD